MRPLVVSLLLRWFAVVGGLSAYAVAIVGGFWLVPVACASTGVWVLHALMALCLVVAAASLVVAWVLWRGAPGPGPDHHPAAPRVRGTGGRLHLLGVLSGRVGLAIAGLLWSVASPAPSHAPPMPAPPDRPQPERERLMALVGVLLGVLSVVLVLFHWAPVFVLDPCR